MKKITVFLSATVLLVALFAATAFKPLPPGPSANGQGTLTLPGDISRHFSFHANTMPDESVKGSGVLTYTANQLKIHFDINCLRVSGNTAWMSGVITKNDDAPERVGWQIRFKVVDNGEGSNANADEMTLMQLSPTLPDCSNQINIALSPIEGGNIQVKN